MNNSSTQCREHSITEIRSLRMPYKIGRSRVRESWLRFCFRFMEPCGNGVLYLHFERTSYTAFRESEGNIYLLHVEVDIRAHWSQVQRLRGAKVVSQRRLRMFAITLL